MEEHEGHGDRGRGTGREQEGQLRVGACGAEWAKRVAASRGRDKGRRKGRGCTLRTIVDVQMGKRRKKKVYTDGNEKRTSIIE